MLINVETENDEVDIAMIRFHWTQTKEFSSEFLFFVFRQSLRQIVPFKVISVRFFCDDRTREACERAKTSLTLMQFSETRSVSNCCLIGQNGNKSVWHAVQLVALVRVWASHEKKIIENNWLSLPSKMQRLPPFVVGFRCQITFGDKQMKKKAKKRLKLRLLEQSYILQFESELKDQVFLPISFSSLLEQKRSSKIILVFSLLFLFFFLIILSFNIAKIVVNFFFVANSVSVDLCVCRRVKLRVRFLRFIAPIEWNAIDSAVLPISLEVPISECNWMTNPEKRFSVFVVIRNKQNNQNDY